MRFLHTADWQLGMTRHFLDADAQPRYSAARIDAIGRIGELARRESCAFVLVCGDVFESNAISPRVVSRSLEAMRALEIPVYLLPGNHDPLDASSIYASAGFTASCPPNVHVLRDEGPVQVSPGVEIVAAPWFSKRPLGDLVGEAIAPLTASKGLRIVAGHGMADVLSPDRSDPSAIATAALEEAIADGRIHYVALGDRHSRTRVGSSGRVWYSGTPEMTDYDESDAGLVLVVELEPGRPAVVVGHRVGTWSFLPLAFAVNGPGDVRALDEQLTALTAKDRTVIKLSLTGTLALRDKAHLDSVLERHERVFAGVEIWQRHTNVVVYVSGDELTELGVAGFAQTAVAELSATARGEGDAATRAQDALSLLFRLAGGAR